MAKERPILFSAPMVRAILAGGKTQTRRILKPMSKAQAEWLTPELLNIVPHVDVVHTASGRYGNDFGAALTHPKGGPLGWIHCPYGQSGDHLWVRESFQPLLDESLGADPDHDAYDYKTGKGYAISYPATDGIQEFYDMASDSSFCSRMTPSIHMPRWASRLTLEITNVQVERLRDISDADAIAEGLIRRIDTTHTIQGWQGTPDSPVRLSPTAAYCDLWEAINGVGSWNTNPWVWAVSFKRVEVNHAS